METHSNPLADAGGDAARTVTEVATLASIIWQQAALQRARKAQAEADTIMQVEARHAEARTIWDPFLDPSYRADATLTAAMEAWYEAGPYSDSDQDAARALAGAEEVMHRENPYATGRYRKRVEAGMSRPEAMKASAPDFAWNGAHGAPAPGRGMTETNARSLGKALAEIAELSEKSAREGRGPLTPAEAVKAVRKMDRLPPGLADRIAQGLSEYTILIRSGSVADIGPAAKTFPGGSSRTARRSGRASSRRSSSRRTTDTLVKQRRRHTPSA
jgi:hypothetical protein